MTLRQKQSKFVRMTARLILHAGHLGYELTTGDAFRQENCPYGQKHSLHKIRLAQDYNVFKDGVFLNGHGQYDDLGEYWESIGGSWGGRFDDDNHFSLAHNGMK
jgi:hypothetical protein